MMTEESGEYNIVVIENDNLYLSPDNQYIKTTPCRTIVCVKGDIDTLVSPLEGFNARNIDNFEVEAEG